MGLTDSRQETLFQTSLKSALMADQISSDPPTPLSSLLTGLMKHGGLHTLLDTEMMSARMAPLLAAVQKRMDRGSSDLAETFSEGDAKETPKQPKMMDANGLAAIMQSKVTYFFSHLVRTPYPIPSNLISHITSPLRSRVRNAKNGVLYTDPIDESDHPKRFESKTIEAAFTFVGQFIDHDLTMNAVNLFEPQDLGVVDEASPLIDLDSVYGPRISGTLPEDLEETDLFEPTTGRFRLDTSRPGVTDLLREKTGPMRGTPTIADKRNDENQLLLQIHLLIMRFHNALVERSKKSTPAAKVAEAYREVLLTWQSIVLYEYLPKIVDQAIIDDVVDAITKQQYHRLVHAPLKDLASGRLVVTLPHEFAIGFRFGHSQLRARYELQRGKHFPLFESTFPVTTPGGPFPDLRGGQELQRDRQIDWKFFLGGGHIRRAVRSNAIDDHVTNVVFDLPESTIPDDIKSITNLTLRNLIRSNQVGLGSGEELARLYVEKTKNSANDVKVVALEPREVEPTGDPKLYQEVNGVFSTPLWYYILREAAVKRGGAMLGPMGGHLVAEVLVGAIMYNQDLLDSNSKIIRRKIVVDSKFKSKINGTNKVTLLELANFVTAAAPGPARGRRPAVGRDSAKRGRSTQRTRKPG